MKRRVAVVFLFVVLGWAVGAANAAMGPSFDAAKSSVIERLRTEKDSKELRRLDPEDIVPLLTQEERRVFGTEYWSFDLSAPAVVWIARYERQREECFWLEDQGFEKTSDVIVAGDYEFELWRKEFDAGHVGLGINGFRLHRQHYFVIVTPQVPGTDIDVEAVWPERQRVVSCEIGARVYGDEADMKIEKLPIGLDGYRMVQAITERGEETQLTNLWRTTPYPSSKVPDLVVLTWSDDPETTQTIQWRTSPEVDDGVVRYRQEGAAEFSTVSATVSTFEDPFLSNDAVNRRYEATLIGLTPDTTYRYLVGSPTANTWSEEASFTTAPAEAENFSFIYMGDAQTGLEEWGGLLHEAIEKHPDVRFCLMAGDLVNRGNDRDDWDTLFQSAGGVYDRVPVAPAIGNHEYHGGEGPDTYLAMFDMPDDGPEGIEPEHSYAFTYSNALFVMLDANQSPKDQAPWLEEQLRNTDATWKFVCYHQPIYSSTPDRDNPLLRKYWGELFDDYHVDFALQGHDHAYLRTPPMRADEKVDSPAKGTIYVVSVAGDKFYAQEDHDYTEVGFVKTSTYQVLDIAIDDKTLTYRSYDANGELRDEVLIQK